MDDRTCKVCGEPLARKPGERPSRFAGRLTCGGECGRKLAAGVRYGAKPETIRSWAETPSVKPCEQCGIAFSRKAGESPADFRDRKVCGKRCQNARQAIAQRMLLPEKRCQVCGRSFGRGAGEQVEHYRSRKSCSRRCADVRHGRIMSHWQRGEASDTQRSCGECGRLYSRRPDELATTFKRRQTCGDPACAARVRVRAKTLPLPDKRCPVCGIEFGRRVGQTASHFRSLVCCSEACARHRRWMTRRRFVERKTPYPPEWTPALRATIRKRDGNLCRLCGATRGKRNLPVHHIDYDKDNCAPDNLISLCTTCHSRTNHGDRAEWSALFRAMMVQAEGTAEVA